MSRLFWSGLVAVAALGAAQPALAINGADLALRSFGATGSPASDWNLTENGYVGTYITLAQPGEVTISVSASGQSGGGADPRMNIVVGDQTAPFNVASEFSAYQHKFALPAGTHFVRTEYTNDFVSNSIPAANRQLTVRSLNVTGAAEANDDADQLALDAAETYIQNYRRGPARVQLYGATPGTPVSVKLTRHAFNFGANQRGTTITGNPGTNQQDVNFYYNNAAYVNFFKKHFNAVVPSNAGKWVNNEAVAPNGRDVQSLAAMDAILNFAVANGMRNRMHNLIWEEQQPNFVNTMIANPNSTDPDTGFTNLLGLYGATTGSPDQFSEISERIDYYVGDGDGDVADGDRAQKYVELDVYNESVHRGVAEAGANDYWDRLGAAGIANIYEETAQAVAAAGSSAKLYLNEFNVLQFSTDPTMGNASDPYANWYRRHIETLQNVDGDPTDGPVQGVGMQLYARGGHSANTMQQALQNLSVGGLQLSLTEFGVSDDVTDLNEAADILENSMRMIFGSPQAKSFLIWGWGSGSHTNADLQGSSVLVNSSDWTTLTTVGQRYEEVLGIDANPSGGWTTNLPSLAVGADGAIDFTGFYGLYEIKVGSTTYTLDLTKGTSNYGLIVGPPSADFDLDGDRDGADFLAWQRGFGTPSGAAFALGDANFDRQIDAADLALWISQLGAASPTAETTPEPAGAALAMVGCLVAAAASRRRPHTGRPLRRA